MADSIKDQILVGLFQSAVSNSSSDLRATYQSLFGVGGGNIQIATSFYQLGSDELAFIYTKGMFAKLIEMTGKPLTVNAEVAMTISRHITGSSNVYRHLWFAATALKYSGAPMLVEIDGASLLIASTINIARNIGRDTNASGLILKNLFDCNELFDLTGMKSEHILYNALMSIPRESLCAVISTLGTLNRTVAGTLIKSLSIIANSTSESDKDLLKCLLSMEFGDKTFNQFIGEVVRGLPTIADGQSVFLVSE